MLPSSFDSSTVIQQHNQGKLRYTHIWTHTSTHGVVYLKATIEASLTVRANCLRLVKQERQLGLQLSNTNPTVLSRALPLFDITHES